MSSGTRIMRFGSLSSFAQDCPVFVALHSVVQRLTGHCFACQTANGAVKRGVRGIYKFVALHTWIFGRS